jgi:hypothetical protein
MAILIAAIASAVSAQTAARHRPPPRLPPPIQGNGPHSMPI